MQVFSEINQSLIKCTCINRTLKPIFEDTYVKQENYYYLFSCIIWLNKTPNDLYHMILFDQTASKLKIIHRKWLLENSQI